MALLGIVGLTGSAFSLEASQSYLQSLVFSRAAKNMTFTVGDGPSPDISFPKVGPYDQRLGYVTLSSFIHRLTARHFVLERQARQSPALRQFIEMGGFAVYHEKLQAGLTLKDRSGKTLEEARSPSLVYQRFKDIPAILVGTLRFIEDRDLLDPERPYRNPAVEWRRLILAAIGWIGGSIDGVRHGGGSTLATQIEKYRHSPGGRTEGVAEKLQQLTTATARAYLNGRETMSAQKGILTTYLDSTPLSSRLGYGEIRGLGDGLLQWYGTDFTEANRLLSLRAPAGSEASRRAEYYKQALSLLIAQRRPSFYLNTGRDDLERLTNAYLRALAAAGVIDRPLRDAALKLPLTFAREPPVAPSTSFVERKAVDAVRTELMTTLGVPNLYSLDQMDFSAKVSIDGAAQSRIASTLERLREPQTVRTLGLVGDQLLGNTDPGKVAWSVVLYERDKGRNFVRIHADSLQEPFDINSGAKLILGSTAKLRTLVTYLGIIDSLHRQLSGLSDQTLLHVATTTTDPLRRWSAAYLATSAPTSRGLQSMLDAAMLRRYSANPSEVFFTGGGAHIFHNFERSEDSESPTVAEAFEHSINLAFVRLLRDVVQHYEAESRAREGLLVNPESPLREGYLRRFADQEGRTYLFRFYDEYKDLSPDDALNRLADQVRSAPRKLAIVFRSVRPQASLEELDSFLARQRPGGSAQQTDADLYSKYGPEKFSLDDRAYLAGINPLELWLVGYLQSHPHATRSQIVGASAEQRQEAYAWLFKTRSSRKQDARIRILIEEDAFDRLLQDWKRQGYPFSHLVPSLATVIGSSGDRPDALATLMGIILNKGVRQPTTDLEQVHFAAGTPYDTEMAYKPTAPERVTSREVAETLWRALTSVVESGTGARLRGVYTQPDGRPLLVGGKTGTGDNRFETFGPGHQLLQARVVDRTATFVFFLGDQFYGTITAYVPGKDAADYNFTSALPVSLLKALEPELLPLVEFGKSNPAVVGAAAAERS
jgi:membrane peptidoglycan carboxypeptidase